MKSIYVIGVALFSVHPCVAQAPLAIYDSNPSQFVRLKQVSPNEAVTFVVLGLKVLPAVADPGTAPTELAGIAVTIEDPAQGLQPTRLPILRIDPSGCGQGWSNVCEVRAVTVQMPPNLKLTTEFGSARPAFTVWQDGVAGIRTEFQAVGANVQMLNSCDWIVNILNSDCYYMVTHEDGSRVDRDSPARLGEIVVLQATGLGSTGGGPAPGVPSPDTPIPTLYQFEASMQAMGGDLTRLIGESTIRPAESSELIPGTIGVYRLRVRVPDELDPAAGDCVNGLPNGNTTPANFAVQIRIKGSRPNPFSPNWVRSFATFCVQPF